MEIMEINENEIVRYIEPVFNFCAKRLNSRHDAEDLASEIMVHVLNGIKKYHIDSLENWVWRIAHNRYARFIDMKNKRREIPYENDFTDFTDICDDYDFVDDIIIIDEYQQVFKYLHTLSSEYRNILVDYYIGQLPVKQIAKNYALTETTVKWRLNISREKIKTRIGENKNKMDKIYKRINWRTTGCNGSMDSNKYLYSQIARAICEAAYEKPLTVEEISLKSGLPTMYIEDELPRLINGDAIIKDGNKYATNFIVLRLCDKKVMGTKFAPLVNDIADSFEKIFAEQESDIAKMDFYGSDFTMKRLGYIALPAVMRCKICHIIDDLGIDEGPFPPRLDGGYGWFLIYETENEKEALDDMMLGNNYTGDDNICLYYLYVCRYFNDDVYRNHGTQWIWHKKLVEKATDGIIPTDALTDDERVKLLKNNLIFKDGDNYKLNFPIFEREQFDAFLDCLYKLGDKFDGTLAEIISYIHKYFKAVVPKHLENQINVWVKTYSYNIIGFVAEELIKRGVLEMPDSKIPLTNGVLCVKNKGDLKI